MIEETIGVVYFYCIFVIPIVFVLTAIAVVATVAVELTLIRSVSLKLNTDQIINRFNAIAHFAWMAVVILMYHRYIWRPMYISNSKIEEGAIGLARGPVLLAYWIGFVLVVIVAGWGILYRLDRKMLIGVIMVALANAVAAFVIK